MITPQRKSRVHLLNRVLNRIPTFAQEVGNKARAKALNLNEATYYAARKTLRQMKRIDEKDKVISPRKITPEEYAKFGFPYGKNKKKTTRIVKGSKKKVAKRKPVHTARAATAKEIRDALGLKEPPMYMPAGEGRTFSTEQFPIREEQVPGEITIKGTPDDLAAFFNKLK